MGLGWLPFAHQRVLGWTICIVIGFIGPHSSILSEGFFFFCYHGNRHCIKQSNRLPLKESTKLTYTTSSTQNEIRTQPRKKHPAQLKDLWIPLSLVLEDLWILSSLALSICISKTNKHCQAPSLLKLKKIGHSDDPSTLKTTNAIKEHYMKQNPQ